MTSEIEQLKAENESLKKALEALMQADFNGHSVESRLQFSTKGREILEIYYRYVVGYTGLYA